MPLFDRSGRAAGKLTAGPTLLLASDPGEGLTEVARLV